MYIPLHFFVQRENAVSLRLCGSTLPAYPFISAGRTVHVDMLTDLVGEGSGFVIQYFVAGECYSSITSSISLYDQFKQYVNAKIINRRD